MVSQLLSGHRKGREVDTQKRIAQGLGMSHARMVAEIRGEPVPGDEPTDVEQAITADRDLTPNQKRILLENYFELRRRRRGG